eukprot:4747308-Alexandrium_andersonii.AAC.1
MIPTRTTATARDPLDTPAPRECTPRKPIRPTLRVTKPSEAPFRGTRSAALGGVLGQDAEHDRQEGEGVRPGRRSR